jgi:phosphoenolpyruvate carboxykinase (ATP)
LLQPRTCPNVPNSILSPRKTWNNDIKYYKTAYKLAKSFIKNFENFESYANDEIMKGKPNLE